jgi:hypothetical protein
MQALPDNPPPSSFPSNVSALIEQMFDGNSAALTRVLRVTRKTVVDWAEGQLRPSVASLLAYEYCFGVRAIDWITTAVSPVRLQAPRPIDTVLAERIHRVPRKHDPEVVRRELTRAVEGDDFPPPSLRAVCLRLGCQQNIAMRRFPELARQIISRFKTFQAERKRQHELFMKMALESAVNQLLHEGRALSFHQLAKVLPKCVSIRDKRVLLEFKRLRKEAEDEMQAVMQEAAVPP